MDPELQSILDRFLDEDVLMSLMMGAVAVTAIVCGSIGSALKFISRERTRRELAAYLSEGTITPEQAERILKAKTPNSCM